MVLISENLPGFVLFGFGGGGVEEVGSEEVGRVEVGVVVGATAAAHSAKARENMVVWWFKRWVVGGFGRRED